MGDTADQIEMGEDEHGTRIWHLNGQLHRPDGPAVERANGGRMWFQNGRLHRTDGPAVELADGTAGSWYLNDVSYEFDEWAKELGIYDTEEFVMMRLTYG